MRRGLSLDRVEEALRVALQGLQQIQTAKEPVQWNESNLWAELMACLLGSAVPFALAHTFAEHLKSGGFLELSDFRSNPARYARRLEQELRRPLPVPNSISASLRRYRFPRLRAGQICRTAAKFQQSGTTLEQLLESCASEQERRQRLVKTCVGIGPKQASLFLRNVGWASELAILDVHVLRFMDYAVFRKPVRPPGSCLKAYERIEARLRRYAEEFGAQLGQLDAAIWLVMRVLRQEAAAWL